MESGKVWVISDGRGLTGDLNACLGVAEKLGGDIAIIDIKTDIDAAGGIKQFLSNNMQIGYSTPEKWPDFVVTCGTLTAPISADIKKIAKDRGSNTPIVNVQIRTPDQRYNEFDLIVMPSHEPPITNYNVNVMTTMGVPHRVNEETLRQGRDEWIDQLSTFIESRYGGKKLFVVLGGDIPSSSNGTGDGGVYTPELAKEFGEQITNLAKQEGACVLVTNSHRTSADASKAFMDAIDVPAFFHDVNMNHEQNPYMGLMDVADMIIVSADSISVCCEATSTGKSVLIAGTEMSILNSTHKQFVNGMLLDGYADEFDPKRAFSLQYRRPQDALSETKRIAAAAREIYQDRLREFSSSVLR